MRVSNLIRGVFFVGLGLLPVNNGAFAQQVLFVDQAATGLNEGTSWSDAFVFLQDALTASSVGDEIWVAAGTYKPDEGVSVTPGNREASFVISGGVSVYGGFTGNESSRDERDWLANETILSGDLLDNDDELLTRDNPTRTDNSYQIVRTGDLTNDVTVDGLTVAGGMAVNNPLLSDGAAVQIQSYVPGQTSKAYISNCLFSNNVSNGGTLYISALSDGVNPVVIISDSIIRNNTSMGIFVNSGTTLIQNVQITENKPGDGSFSALWVNRETVYLVGSTISNNHAGIVIKVSGTDGSDAVLYMWNNKIIGNYGGGSHIEVFKADLVSINNIFSGNTNPSVGFGAGAIYLNESDAWILNNVFAFNSSGGSGGSIRSEVSNVRISNSIFHQNTAPTDPDITNPYPDFGTIRISHSVLDHPLPSYVIDRGGLIFDDPVFADANGEDDIPGTADDDFRLLLGSPAIDAGINDSLYIDFLDIDGDGNFAELWPADLLGNTRVFNGGSGTETVDIGPFEFGAPPVGTFVFEAPETSILPGGSLSIYPNPAYSRFTLTWNHAAVLKSRLSIYDVSGRLVQEIYRGPLLPMDQLRVTVTDLSPGVYLVYESASGQSGRVVVLR